MQYPLTFKTLNLQKTHESVVVLNKIAHKLADISEIFDFQIILAEETVKVSGHKTGLLEG
jgi:hypothetical protein